ncbi:MAG: hydroxymethylbilane synthase [Planctomycetota bacterium]|jgi:hydroxymethylbilane synthase
MTTLRMGTRGSRLALTQSRHVAATLQGAHAGLTVEEIVIKTHGDAVTDRPFDESWPVGSFVGALEQALAAGEIDFAVHSFKDLPSQSPPGLVIAAVPPREAVHDVLVTRTPLDLDALPAGLRVGTSSPRRAAQFRRAADVEIVQLRGNVPTRLEKLQGDDLDAVILAAAGLRRLGLAPEHVIDLPPERFVPSPAQGALAVQTRRDDPAEPLVAAIQDGPSRRTVDAERSFLARVEAGCQTPLGAWATLVDDDAVELHAQLFREDGTDLAEGVERGDDPVAVGHRLGDRLLAELGD